MRKRQRVSVSDRDTERKKKEKRTETKREEEREKEGYIHRCERHKETRHDGLHKSYPSSICSQKERPARII